MIEQVFTAALMHVITETHLMRTGCAITLNVTANDIKKKK